MAGNGSTVFEQDLNQAVSTAEPRNIIPLKRPMRRLGVGGFWCRDTVLQERLRAPAGELFSIKQQAGGLLGRKQGRSKSCSGPRVFIKREKKKNKPVGND